ncbi:MAG: hypothetical protein ACHQ01_07970 [Candidatus Limnocylindrales bacterium]
MDGQAGDSLKADSTLDRGDRSVLALVEIGAAAILIGSFLVPWYVIAGPGYTTWIAAGGGSSGALTTPDLLIPFATLIAVVVTFAGLAFPARGAKIAILVAFTAALYGGILEFQDVLYGDQSGWVTPPTPAWGLWLFAGTAAAGVAVVLVDLVRGGSSTFLWRAMRRPSMRRYGSAVAYVVMLLITLPVVLFPMFPQWWLFVWCAALLMGPLWVVRARQAR